VMTVVRGCAGWSPIPYNAAATAATTRIATAKYAIVLASGARAPGIDVGC
jgi:hypothetical protein